MYKPFKFCGKTRHDTKADAIKAAVSAKRGGRKRRTKGLKGSKSYLGSGAKIKVYRCPTCGFFHWTNYIKGSKHSKVMKRNQ